MVSLIKSKYCDFSQVMRVAVSNLSMIKEVIQQVHIPHEWVLIILFLRIKNIFFLLILRKLRLTGNYLNKIKVIYKKTYS